jgi:hypothetical protein
MCSHTTGTRETMKEINRQDGEVKGFRLFGTCYFRNLQKELRLVGPVSHWYQDGRVVKTVLISNTLTWLEDLGDIHTIYVFSLAPNAVAIENSRHIFYSHMVRVAPEFPVLLCKEAARAYSELQDYVAKGFPIMTGEKLRDLEWLKEAEIPFENFQYDIQFSWDAWKDFVSKVNSEQVNKLFGALQSKLDTSLKRHGLNKPWFYDYCLKMLSAFDVHEPQRFIKAITPPDDYTEDYGLSLIIQDDEPELREKLKTFLINQLDNELKPSFYKESVEVWLNRVKSKIDDFKPLAKNYMREKNLIPKNEISEISIEWLVEYLFIGKSQKEIADDGKGEVVGEDAVGKLIRKAAGFLEIDLPERRGKKSSKPTF